MAKELTCEIVHDYGSIDIDENNSIKICEVKWNGRKPKGYDIRRYQKDEDRLGKGITIPYDNIEELIDILVKNNLCDLNILEEKIKEQKSSFFNINDFNFMFEKMNDEMIKYTRDKYGHLRDKDNRIVIASRRKKGA